jgi:putative DNA primase/helicase
MTPAPKDGFDPDEVPPWEMTGPRMMYQRADEVVPTAPVWLWERWLLAAALHLLVGRQGGGKTTFAAWLMALLTTGQRFPGGHQVADAITCAVLSLEEPADRLVARLVAAGADVSRVVIVGDVEAPDDEGRLQRRPWRLPQDCGVLEQLLSDEKVGFLCVDGLGYSVAGSSQDYATIGSALSALAGVAERTGCSILGLSHPPKGTSDPVTSAIGSTAWTAVSRVVWVLGADPDDESGATRAVRVSKSNFKLPDDGLAFRLGDNEQYECGYVTGLATSTVTAEELVAAAMPAEERTDREEARELVRSILRAGPMETSELLVATRKAGASDRTVERARRDLGVKAKPTHDSATGKMIGWVVALPDPPCHTTPPDTPKGGVGGVGGVVMTSSFSSKENTSPPSPPTPPSLALVGDVAAIATPFFDRPEF